MDNFKTYSIYLISLLISTNIFPAYNNCFDSIAVLPKDTTVKIINYALIDLIKDTISPVNSANKLSLKEFFHRASRLRKISEFSKQAVDFYIPFSGRNLKELTCGESLLCIAIENNWNNLIKLIMDFNINFTREEKEAFLKWSMGIKEPALPKDMIMEIVKHMLISLIKDAVAPINSADKLRFKKFFKQVSELRKINKWAKAAIDVYIPFYNRDLLTFYSGESLLHIAIENNWSKLVDLILNSSDINLSQREKNIALKWFTINKNDIMVKKLLEMNANPKSDSAILKMADDNNINIVEAFQKNIYLSIDSNRELYEAIEKDNLSTVEYLILNGANVNSKYCGNTPLIKALDLQRREIVKFLLKCPNIDVNKPNDSGFTPLGAALFKDRVDICTIELLLFFKAGVNIGLLEDTPLIIASRVGSDAAVKLLLQYKADINKQGKDGYTALMHAAYAGYENIVRLLLQSNANKNLENNQKKTAYDCSNDCLAMRLKNEKVEKVKALLAE